MSDHVLRIYPSDESDVLCTADVEGFKVMVLESSNGAEHVTFIEPTDATYDMFIVIPDTVLADVNGEVAQFITTLIAQAHRDSL